MKALGDSEEDASITVEKTQQVDGWASAIENIAGIDIDDINSTEDTVVAYAADTGIITIDDNAVNEEE